MICPLFCVGICFGATVALTGCACFVAATVLGLCFGGSSSLDSDSLESLLSCFVITFLVGADCFVAGAATDCLVAGTALGVGVVAYCGCFVAAGLLACSCFGGSLAVCVGFALFVVLWVGASSSDEDSSVSSSLLSSSSLSLLSCFGITFSFLAGTYQYIE